MSYVIILHGISSNLLSTLGDSFFILSTSHLYVIFQYSEIISSICLLITLGAETLGATVAFGGITGVTLGLGVHIPMAHFSTVIGGVFGVGLGVTGVCLITHDGVIAVGALGVCLSNGSHN